MQVQLIMYLFFASQHETPQRAPAITGLYLYPYIQLGLRNRYKSFNLTTFVIYVWAGVDSAWEQKILENTAESHTSGACFVGLLLDFEN